EFYEPAPGHANYWFNRYHQQRVWNSFLAHGDFAEVSPNWRIVASDQGGGEVEISLTQKLGAIVMPAGKSETEFTLSLIDATGPPGSGGLLTTLHLWQRLLLDGPRRFGDVRYYGTLPWNSDEELADCLVGIR